MQSFPATEVHVVAPATVGGVSSRRRETETLMRLALGAACLALVMVSAVCVGGQAGAEKQQRDALLSGKLSDNYYVDARVAQHRAERKQELSELRAEAAEKRQRKAAFFSQEKRQVEDEDAMANKMLDRYNAIYTADTPEEAALEATASNQLPSSAQPSGAYDQLDQYDAPVLTVARAYGRAGLTAYNGGVVPKVKTQNLASAPIAQPQQPQSVKALVYAVSKDIGAVEGELEGSPEMQEQRGSLQLKDILDSSMLEISGLAKRVGARLATAKAEMSTLRLTQPESAAAPVESASAPMESAAAPMDSHAVPVSSLPAPVQQQSHEADVNVAAPSAESAAVMQVKAQIADDKRIEERQTADDQKINAAKPYPSMQSMVAKYKAWMEAKKEMAMTGSAMKSAKTQGLTALPLGSSKSVIQAAEGPCAMINRAHAGESNTLERENACSKHTIACKYDFGYQLCLEK